MKKIKNILKKLLTRWISCVRINLADDERRKRKNKNCLRLIKSEKSTLKSKQ